MTDKEIKQIHYMLTALYKKLDQIENKIKGSSRSASMKSYYNELLKDAEKVKKDIETN